MEDRFLTCNQNANWLKISKSLERSEQWIAIKQRFFYEENCNVPVDSVQYSPLIVINGVPFNIPSKLTREGSREILKLLNEDSIEQIVTIDELSKEWTLCKPFSGVLILTIDSRIAKRLFKLRLE